MFPPLPVVLAALLTSSEAAPLRFQHRPDFSGQWVLQSPPEPPQGTSRTLGVEHEPSFISITRTIDGRPHVTTHRFDSGASFGGTVSADGRQSARGVWWFGDALRFDEGTYSAPAGGAGDYFERNEVWSLTGDGRLSIEISIRRSGERTVRTTLTYRKRMERR